MAVDATGKVKGTAGSIVDDAVVTRNQKSRPSTHANVDTSGIDASAVLDRVDVGVAKNIQDSLDPVKLSEERKAKVAKLKQLIDAGQYNPTGTDIARSVADEISQEIFFGKAVGDYSSTKE